MKEERLIPGASEVIKNTIANQNKMALDDLMRDFSKLSSSHPLYERIKTAIAEIQSILQEAPSASIIDREEEIEALLREAGVEITPIEAHENVEPFAHFQAERKREQERQGIDPTITRVRDGERGKVFDLMSSFLRRKK